jgi:CelD/BcsL family acetyltransferase involved in cellulose biosynthesis
VGSSGDLAIFCLYKTFGLPDGAALIVRRGAPQRPVESSLGVDRLARRHAAWAVARSNLFGRVTAALADPARPQEVGEDFAIGAVRAPSRLASFLIPKLRSDVAARRRAHYELLLNDLRDDVPPPFAELPAGAVPFAFPIATPRKQEVVDRFERGGVKALDLWSIPHPALPATRFPAARERRATTVGLPVHQELRPSDLDRLVRLARSRPRTFRYDVEWIEDLEPLRGDWDRLAIESGNVFATWEWASIWWRRYGDGKRLRVGACRDGTGRIFALLPLYEWRRRPARVFRFLGHGTGDQLGPICSPRNRAVTARALRHALHDLRCDILLAEHLVAREGWAALIGGGKVLRQEGYPLIRCTGGWDAYLSTRSANFRMNIRRWERKLGREHDLRYRFGGSAAALEADLDTLFSLHRKRWAEQTEFAAAEEFHRELAAHFGSRGWLRLWFLELDGEPVAAWYGFRFAGTESYFQSGRDPARAEGSVGSALLAHTIREALSDGIAEYRFLRGGEPYKYRFASEDPGLETLGFAAGPGSTAALLAGRAAARLQLARTVARAALSPRSTR